MSAREEWRSLLQARVRFRNGNDVVEGEVVGVGPHLVKVVDDAGDPWVVDRYSIGIVGGGGA